jgi:Predicted membrane protein
MGILWTIIIGFVAGIIAKFIMPGDNEPTGFILTTILGIVGAFARHFSDRRSAGIGRARAQAWSAPW